MRENAREISSDMDLYRDELRIPNGGLESAFGKRGRRKVRCFSNLIVQLMDRTEEEKENAPRDREKATCSRHISVLHSRLRPSHENAQFISIGLRRHSISIGLWRVISTSALSVTPDEPRNFGTE